MLGSYYEKTCVALLMGLLSLSIWFNSGTLTPYAASHHKPLVSEECSYLFNLDHYHFLGPIKFLNGEPKRRWKKNILLRRILYPLLAYPLIHITDFEIGGFLSNIILILLSVFLFYSYIRSRFGIQTALYTLSILVTYPGIIYCSGLPYSYAMIVPCCLLNYCFLALIVEQRGTLSLITCSFAIGILALAYDLLPYFLPALILILLYQKRITALLVSIPLAVSPTAFVLWIFTSLYRINPSNSNSEIYGKIIQSYLHPPELTLWWEQIRETHLIFLHNFFYSSFLILPALFVFLLLVHGLMRRVFALRLVEIALFLSILAVFLFSNVAPPYEAKWQLRGYWIARLYQPLFIVFLMGLTRIYHYYEKENLSKKSLWIFTLLAIGCNSVIIFGPISGYPKLAAHVYYNHYQHSKPHALLNNIKRYGRRPIGYCIPQKRT